jgi:hypothetical protein
MFEYTNQCIIKIKIKIKIKLKARLFYNLLSDVGDKGSMHYSNDIVNRTSKA